MAHPRAHPALGVRDACRFGSRPRVPARDAGRDQRLSRPAARHRLLQRLCRRHPCAGQQARGGVRLAGAARARAADFRRRAVSQALSRTARASVRLRLQRAHRRLGRRRAGLEALIFQPEGAWRAASFPHTRKSAPPSRRQRTSRTRSPEARELEARGTHASCQLTQPAPVEGQKTAAFEIGEELGAVPEVLALPYGGGGNLVPTGKASEERRTPRLVAVQASERADGCVGDRIVEPAHVDAVGELLKSGRAKSSRWQD